MSSTSRTRSRYCISSCTPARPGLLGTELAVAAAAYSRNSYCRAAWSGLGSGLGLGLRLGLAGQLTLTLTLTLTLSPLAGCRLGPLLLTRR